MVALVSGLDSTRVPWRTLRYARNAYLTVRLIEANRAILSAYTRTGVKTGDTERRVAGRGCLPISSIALCPAFPFSPSSLHFCFESLAFGIFFNRDKVNFFGKFLSPFNFRLSLPRSCLLFFVSFLPQNLL